jgi:probable rRNA maturation factor
LKAPLGSHHVVVGGTVGRVPVPLLRAAVTYVLQAERRDATIGITVLGPRQMRRLNAEYKHHDRPTDVISFTLPQPDGSLAGDICICPFVAAREARSRGVGVRAEIVRLVVHGTLHILGYDHPEGEDRTEAEMWYRQEGYVKALV